MLDILFGTILDNAQLFFFADLFIKIGPIEGPNTQWIQKKIGKYNRNVKIGSIESLHEF